MSEHPPSHFEPLWDALSKETDAQRPPHLIAQRAQAFAQAADTPAPSRRASRLVLATCAASACALVVWSFARPEPSLPLAPTEAASPGLISTPVGPMVAQGFPAPSQLFEDGTRLSLGLHSQAEITRAPGHTVLTLVQGTARLAGHHAMANRWVVRAGPYSIEVLGTTFDVQWSPEDGAARVSLEEGRVKVSGPGLAQPRDMLPGDTLALQVPAPAKEQIVASTPAPARPASAPRRRAPEPAWRALAGRHEYSQAIKEARAHGLDRLCKGEPTTLLLKLADAARFAGATHEARKVLKCLRARRAPAAQKATAAYLLGQLAQQAGQREEATRWFARYLEQSPQGPLARETMGRLMDLYPPARARAVAQKYLTRFPRGPHAERARRLLGPAR